MKDMQDSNILKNTIKTLVAAYKVLGVFLILISFGLLIVNASPELWYSLDNGAFESDKNGLISTIEAEENNPGVRNRNRTLYSAAQKLPEKDPSLPNVTTLIINRVGINGQVRTGDGDSVLDIGIWSPSNFAQNPAVRQPIVLSSHRYGLISWTREYRDLNSFYSLPNLAIGDEVIIIHEQRKYTYKIKTMEENTSLRVSDGDDLILVTCKYFRSPERIIVRAEATW